MSSRRANDWSQPCAGHPRAAWSAKLEGEEIDGVAKEFADTVARLASLTSTEPELAHTAAKKAYEAGLGASEWKAFL